MRKFGFAVLGAVVVVSVLAASAVRAEDSAAGTAPAGLRWDREGYAAIADAAVEARAANRRLLLGLSGSPG